MRALVILVLFVAISSGLVLADNNPVGNLVFDVYNCLSEYWLFCAVNIFADLIDLVTMNGVWVSGKPVTLLNGQYQCIPSAKFIIKLYKGENSFKGQFDCSKSIPNSIVGYSEGYQSAKGAVEHAMYDFIKRNVNNPPLSSFFTTST